MAEEPLSQSMVDLLSETRQQPSAANRARVLDAIIDRASKLVLKLAATMSRSLKGHPAK